MKRLVLPILILLFFSLVKAYSAEVSIKYSLVYKNEVPYLEICYCNSGNTDYYLPALFYGNSTIPRFFSHFCSRFHPCSFDKQNVYDGLNSFNGKSFIIYLDYIDVPEKQGIIIDALDSLHRGLDIISSYLEAYYLRFEPFDVFYPIHYLSDESFIQKCPAFIFVRKGESFKQFIDLSGFKIAGVTIHIKSYTNRPPVSIKESWNKEIALPLEVNGFTLYQESVDSYEAVFDFSH